MAQPLVLERHGKGDAVILIPPQPHRMELMAANDLSLYMRRVTGAQIPVVGLYEPQNADALEVLHCSIISVGSTRLAGQIKQRKNWVRLEHCEVYLARN